MLEWLKQILGTAPEEAAIPPDAGERRAERLALINRSHAPEFNPPAKLPVVEPPPGPILLLAPPNYRREIIGRR